MNRILHANYCKFCSYFKLFDLHVCFFCLKKIQVFAHYLTQLKDNRRKVELTIQEAQVNRQLFGLRRQTKHQSTEGKSQMELHSGLEKSII